ncbi:MAG: hypothetical protein MUE31_00445 [Candidatus Nanopelagicales bacterium]|jgi:DNA repair exonuclease SbcCD ATPase subunit|nr:hypothetical protein [Candidatus Nanopelagicales bacterium]
MRRWIISLFLIPALAFTAAPSASAAQDIRGTAQYQELKAYVAQLDAEKSQPQTAAQISKYRSELSKRKAKASAKVRALYQQRIQQVRQVRQNRQAKVQALKQKRNRQVAALKQALQSRLNAIAADRRAAISRINTSYASKQQSLTKQLNKARKKLAKATNPVVKQNLREEISAIQDQLSTLAQEKRADLNVANNKYDDQAEQARETYGERIDNTKEQANENIAQRKNRLRELYQQAKQNAQQRRADGFAVVKSKYDEGVGYINQMQVSGGQ